MEQQHSHKPTSTATVQSSYAISWIPTEPPTTTTNSTTEAATTTSTGTGKLHDAKSASKLQQGTARQWRPSRKWWSDGEVSKCWS